MNASQTNPSQKKELPYPTHPTLKNRLSVVLCDQLNATATVVDLAASDPTSANAILWEWAATPENGFAANGYRRRIDECKLRYSPTLQKYVICVTSSAGFMGIAEYPSGRKIWEDCAAGYGPHSIEYLPNGTVAVALSGNKDENKAEIRLYACDENGAPSQSYVKESFISAHSVVWDPEQSLLWALGKNRLAAYRVGGTPQSPTLTLLEGKGCEVSPSGHDLSASLLDKDLLYLSANSVYRFHKPTNTLQTSFDGSDQIQVGAVKCIAEHTDGSILRTVAAKVWANHDTNVLDVFRKTDSGEWKKTSYTFEGRAFYKARPFIL